MFVGHYGVSLAARRYAPRASLGVLFLAVQLLDVLFAIFVLAGVEKLRVVPGFTRSNPYDLYSMPYTHSLVGAIGWAALAGLAYGVLAQKGDTQQARVAAALVVAVAVFSHFVLDYPVHTPDMPIGFDPTSPKVGLGLWNQPDVTIALELGTLVAGGAVYLGATRTSDAAGDRAAMSFGAVLVLLAATTPFLPDPPSTTAFAVEALVGYGALAAWAEWVDRKRAPRLLK